MGPFSFQNYSSGIDFTCCFVRYEYDDPSCVSLLNMD